MEDRTEMRLPLSNTQINNFIVALQRFYFYQNRDGSWGWNKKSKITLTSQAIHLMCALDVDHDSKAFIKAVGWIKENISKRDEHWCTRLDVGLKIKDFNGLAADSYISEFCNALVLDLEYEVRERKMKLFWDVIPILIALSPYEEAFEKRRGEKIPHKEVVDWVDGYCQRLQGNLISVDDKPNYTGLAALYYFTISGKPGYENCKNDYPQMIDWLLLNKRRENETIDWEDSRGIATLYSCIA